MQLSFFFDTAYIVEQLATAYRDVFDRSIEAVAAFETDTNIMRWTVKHKRLLSIDKLQASSLGHVYFQSHRIGTIPVDPPDDANDGGGISGLSGLELTSH